MANSSGIDAGIIARMTNGKQAASTHELLLVHGTGAASEKDEGDAWWQRGSTFATQLIHGLNGAYALPTGRLFHWSGKNSERHRRAAGQKLLDRLEGEEAKGRSYHLIGHSHGGSVIWHALREAIRRDVSLDQLRSITTVGTPFLHYRARRFTVADLLSGVSALLLTILVAFVATDYVRQWDRIRAEQEIVALAITPVLSVLAFAAACIFGLAALKPLFAAKRLRREAQDLLEAMACYGDRWIAIRSASDEAINGLRRTPFHRWEVLPRLDHPLRDGGFFGPLLWLYNVLVQPVWNAFLARQVAHRLQGNDVQGQALADVTSSPILGAEPPNPSDPHIDSALESAADESAARTVAKLRRALGLNWEARELGPVGGVKMDLDWGELVHTSYFDNEQVVDIIRTHVHSLSKDRGAEPSVPPRISSQGTPLESVVVSARLRYSAALLHIALFAGLAASVGSAHRAFVEPYTDARQVKSVLRDAPLAQAAVFEPAAVVRWIRTVPSAKSQMLSRSAWRQADPRSWVRVATRLIQEAPDEREAALALVKRAHEKANNHPLVLAEVADGYAACRRTAEALKLLDTIKDDQASQIALTAVAKRQAANGEIAKRLPKEPTMDLWADLAYSFARHGHGQQAQDAFKEISVRSKHWPLAASALSRIGRDDDRRYSLVAYHGRRAVIDSALDRGRPDLAWTIARWPEKDDTSLDETLKEICTEALGRQDGTRAYDAASAIRDRLLRIRLLLLVGASGRSTHDLYELLIHRDVSRWSLPPPQRELTTLLRDRRKARWISNPAEQRDLDFAETVTHAGARAFEEGLITLTRSSLTTEDRLIGAWLLRMVARDWVSLGIGNRWRKGVDQVRDQLDRDVLAILDAMSDRNYIETEAIVAIRENALALRGDERRVDSYLDRLLKSIRGGLKATSVQDSFAWGAPYGTSALEADYALELVKKNRLYEARQFALRCMPHHELRVYIAILEKAGAASPSK